MSLTPECLTQLGLRTEPFGPVPEDSALYRDALLDGFGDLGLRALAEPSAVLVLAGAGGVGRSTQLQQILSLVADDTDLIAFRARPKVGFEAVDATLRFHLGQLGSEDASASLLHLFGERLRAGRALLLAIDDAHLLGGSVLERLFSLRRQLLERLGATARLFLVGDPAFAANPLPGLDAEADAQVLRLHLRAFNREQTHAYLRHRLLTAGHAQPDTLLKRELIDRLHTSSSGLPKYLNALAEDWLEECCDQGASFAGQVDRFGQAPSAASAPVRGEVPADAMVSAMTALEALRNASSQALESSERESLRAGASSGARPDGAQGAARAGQSSTAKNRARGGKRSGQTKARAKKSQAAPAGETLPVWNRPWFVPGVAVLSLLALLLPLVWQLPGSEGEDPALRLPPRELPVAPRPRQVPVAPGVPLVGPQPSAPAVEQPLRRELDVPAILPGEPVAENTAEAADAGADSALPAAAGNQAGTDSTESSSEDSAERSSSAAGTDGAESGSGGLDRDWILQQSGEHFTIQLTAARSVAAARQHVAGFGNLDVRFVPTRSKSQDFVIVLAGAYPARADAERALEKLPAALREQGYWVRSIDSVRQSLRE